MEILKIEGLCKRFGEKEVLRSLSLSVPKGSVFGFVGKNGAGKTTTMKAVLGLLRVDAGSILVAGERVRYGETATNRHVGYLPDVPAFYPFMTAREYLFLCGESLGMSRREIAERSEELLTLVGLAGETHRIKGFSRGMKQRLGIAQALLARPALLICDEPTSALDPVGRREILEILSSVRKETTVLFSTHVLSDVERICTDVALIDGGRVTLQGTVEALKSQFSVAEFEVEPSDEDGFARILSAYPHARREGECLVLSGDGRAMLDVLSYLGANGVCVRRIEQREPSLETLFMEVIGK